MISQRIQRPAFRGAGNAARQAGFSLVELLAVILVISILMTVGVMGVRNLSAGKSTTAAIASVEGLFEEARLLAVSKGTKTRLMVDVDDPKEADNYLRRVVLAYLHVDNDGSQGEQWILANRGYQIPQGVFFSQEFSSEDHANNGLALTPEEMSFYMVDKDNVPKAVNTGKTTWNGEYFVYEFNPEGICQSPGSSFILGSGVRSPGADNPRVAGGAGRDFAGLMVWRNGRTSVFRSPAQMGEEVRSISSNENF